MTAPVYVAIGWNHEHRYAPAVVRTCVGMRPVTGYVAHPPGTHRSPIRAALWAVECRTEVGPRWFGCERAYIAADLGMVVVGHDPRDEVRATWQMVPASLRQGSEAVDREHGIRCPAVTGGDAGDCDCEGGAM